MMGIFDRALDASVLFSFDRTGFERHRRRFRVEDLEVRLDDRVILVTGANSGLGYAASSALAGLGATVYLLCRDEARGEAARSAIAQETGSRRVHLALLDVSRLEDVRRFARDFPEPKIDALVHNAGVLPDRRIETPDGLELTWATNVVGAFLLTHLLLPKLEAAGASRVINVTSGGMYLQRLDLRDVAWRSRKFDGVTAYAETKRAEVILTELWADRLAETRITVNAMHPGWADTPSVKSSIPRFHHVMKHRLRSPAEGADTIVWLAASTAVEGASGGLYFDRAPATTHLLAKTKEPESDRHALWEYCLRDAGLDGAP